MKRHLFGTDGVRGAANDVLTPELALELGRAAGSLLLKKSNGGESKPARSSVLVGRDTRRSGQMISSALAAGFCAAGIDVIDAGIVPTPCVAYLTTEQGAVAGAVVSASHNPAADNGIKFFGPDGYKLTDEIESEIESLVESPSKIDQVLGEAIGVVKHAPLLAAIYEAHLVSTVGEGSLAGLRVVLDCANGAAYQSAPSSFAAAGAHVESVFVTPDGDNINDGCGSTDPEILQARVVETGADLGLAFDGDADRVLAVDAKGSIVDGDQILAIAATSGVGRDSGEISGSAKAQRVVATVMANLGFRKAMEAGDIEVIECQVGDRYVIETMRNEGIELGGEQSGHIIFGDAATTGDGLLTGLRLMEVMAKTGKTLEDLASVMTRYPQVLINVKVRNKSLLSSTDSIWSAFADSEKRLGSEGRILVRPSGTEPVVRVMVEAGEMATAQAEAEQIAKVISAEIG